MSVRIVLGDITKIKVDAIVNAANSRLAGGGGVDGAIHQAGGPEIMAACDAIRAEQGGCPTGQAIITPAGRLDATYVIHTVGPIWADHRPAEAKRLLVSCYRSSLELAAEHAVGSIAFPNISTGVYGFPKPLAAELAWSAVQGTGLDVIFVCFDRQNLSLYEALQIASPGEA